MKIELRKIMDSLHSSKDLINCNALQQIWLEISVDKIFQDGPNTLLTTLTCTLSPNPNLHPVKFLSQYST